MIPCIWLVLSQCSLECNKECSLKCRRYLGVKVFNTLFDQWVPHMYHNAHDSCIAVTWQSHDSHMINYTGWVASLRSSWTTSKHWWRECGRRDMISIATSLSKFHRMQKTLSQHCCRSPPSKYHSIFESTVHVAVVMVQSHSQTPDYQSGNEARHWLVPFSPPIPLSECTTCRCSNETMHLLFLSL